MNLRGKRILFIAPKLFGIPENIIQSLQSFGALIDYYDERPANSFIVKALIRINRNLIGAYINKYHSSIITKTEHTQYNYIFFIKGESFSEHNLQILINKHPEAKSIVYHWDSIANNRNALNLLKKFDYKFSFDRFDCEKFEMSFLPLFYYDHYSDISSDKTNFKYDIMFVGTAHSDRYIIIKQISSQVRRMNKQCYIYFFFQGRLMFYKYVLQNKESRDIDKSNVHFDSLSFQELFQLYERSKTIVDVHHPRQSGLTLRCMETLGARRKLVTTNNDIINYDFYNPNNILILDRLNPSIPREFLETPYHEIPIEIYKKYSLSSWIQSIFSH